MSVEEFCNPNLSIDDILALASRREQEIIDRERPAIFKGEITDAEQAEFDRQRREWMRNNTDFVRSLGLQVPKP